MITAPSNAKPHVQRLVSEICQLFQEWHDQLRLDRAKPEEWNLFYDFKRETFELLKERIRP